MEARSHWKAGRNVGNYGMRNSDNLKGTQELMKCLQRVSRAEVRLGVSPALGEEPQSQSQPLAFRKPQNIHGAEEGCFLGPVS